MQCHWLLSVAWRLYPVHVEIVSLWQRGATALLQRSPVLHVVPVRARRARAWTTAVRQAGERHRPRLEAARLLLLVVDALGRVATAAAVAPRLRRVAARLSPPACSSSTAWGAGTLPRMCGSPLATCGSRGCCWMRLPECCVRTATSSGTRGCLGPCASRLLVVPRPWPLRVSTRRMLARHVLRVPCLGVRWQRGVRARLCALAATRRLWAAFRCRRAFSAFSRPSHRHAPCGTTTWSPSPRPKGRSRGRSSASTYGFAGRRMALPILATRSRRLLAGIALGAACVHGPVAGAPAATVPRFACTGSRCWPGTPLSRRW